MKVKRGMEQRWNARAGGGGNGRSPGKICPTSGIVWHDPHMRKSGSDPAGNRTRFEILATRPQHQYSPADQQLMATSPALAILPCSSLYHAGTHSLNNICLKLLPTEKAPHIRATRSRQCCRVYKRLSGSTESPVCTIHAGGDSVVNMDSDEENLLLVFHLRRRRRRRRKQQRLLWMHPLTADRLTSGRFYTIVSELKQDSCKFHSYFRMSKNSFDELLSLLKIHIGKADTIMKKSIPAEERLAITLRKSLHKRWTHQSAEIQLMMQGIDSGTVIDYHQMMSAQMDTGRCTDEYEERRMGEIRHTRLQEVLYLVTGCTFTDLHYIFLCLISTARKIVIEVCETIWQHLHDICFPDLTEYEWLKIANGFETRANFPNSLGAIDGKHIWLIQPAGSG
ncbi:hypothetical protein PR048_010608 [Dryococelus australis]|uniref:DDE Tnp4 domain-containing protein n=1 Tax=Dryococelus australis TaxID=614101 RepID=A0ABQ9I574_9NEOP|nr:hypothetical protein PR048_010608 [Dryococelus australis]